MTHRWCAVLSLLAAAYTFAAQTISKQQESYAPYWTSEPGWMSELQLRNNLPTNPLKVTPVLRLASGREIALDAATISPNSSVSVWVNEGLLAHAPDLLSQPGSYGSVIFRYTSGGALNLHATVVVSMQGEPISIAVPAYPERYNLNTPRGNSAGSLEGIWWQPRSGLTDVLVLGNHSDRKISGRLSLFDAAGKMWSETLILAPRETLRMSTSSLVQKAGLSSNYGGISFAVPDGSSAIQGVRFVYDEISKFSETLELSPRDPNTTLQERAGRNAKNWTMHAPMLALRSPDPALGMPHGIMMQPTILIRNTTGKSVTANLALTWHGGSGNGHVNLPEMQLAPFVTQQLQIGEMQKLLRIPDDAHWAHVTLTTNALPDDLVAVASSIDASGRYALDTRFVGGVGARFAGGEWRADSNHNAIAAITNIGGKPADALLTLHYDNGKQKYELQQTIAPGDQMWVGLQQLIRDRVPDRKGNTLPVDVSSVTYDLQDLTPGNNGLMANALSVDGSFGFQGIANVLRCCNPNSPEWNPPIFDLLIGADAGGQIWGTDPCTGEGVNMTPDFPTWGSDNPSVATVTTQQVHGVAAGSTDAWASGWISEGNASYCTVVHEQPTASVSVQPTISSISPSRGLIGNTLSVTINGTGFGSPSVSAGSGVQVTIDSYSSTQIQATFTIASTANGGNQSVTVTAAGQTSPPANFYVQIPKTMIRDSGYGSGGLGSLVTITNGNVVDIYGNTLLSGECGVYRNIGYFLVDQESPAQNIQGNYTLVETFTNYSTDVQGLTAPPTQDNPIIYDQTMLGDTQFFGTKASSGCPGSNDHESFDQHLTVQIDSSHSYVLSMVNTISRGYYSGTATVNVTISSP